MVTSKVDSFLGRASGLTTLAIGIPAIIITILHFVYSILPSWLVSLLFGALAGMAIIAIATTILFGSIKLLIQGYSIERSEYKFKIGDDTDWRNHTNDVVITIKATRSGVRIFENRYFWTGSGEEYLPTILSDGHELMGAVHQDNSWHNYYIYLERALSRGETATIHIRQKFVDRDARLGPFHTKTVYERCKHLSITTEFSSGALATLKPADFSIVEWKRDEPRAKLISRTSSVLNSAGTLTSEFEKTRRRHRYGHEWSWHIPKVPSQPVVP